MKKMVIVAALIAASVAVPTLPVQAQSALPEIDENCVVLPMFKRDCVEAARAAWLEARPATIAEVAVLQPPPAPPAPPALLAAPEAPNLPALPTCTRAPAGSGYLFDC